MSIERRKVPAFKNDLLPSGIEKPDPLKESRLLEFENDDRYIVREPEDFFLAESDQSSPEAFALKAKKLFDELKDYKIHAPVHFIVAQNEDGEPKVFIVTERVEAMDFNTLDSAEKEVARQEIRHIFENLMSYYEAKEKSDGDVLWDVPQLGQFVYGKLPMDQHNTWYLVDSDPYFGSAEEKLYEAVETLDAEVSHKFKKELQLNMADVSKRAKALMRRLEAY